MPTRRTPAEVNPDPDPLAGYRNGDEGEVVNVISGETPAVKDPNIHVEVDMVAAYDPTEPACITVRIPKGALTVHTARQLALALTRTVDTVDQVRRDVGAT